MPYDDERKTMPDWYDTHCPTCDAPEPTHTATCAVVHSQGQISEAMVEAARKAIHRSIVLNHFAAIAAADTWDQNDYEAMLNEFAVVALEAALNAKEDS